MYYKWHDQAKVPAHVDFTLHSSHGRDIFIREISRKVAKSGVLILTSIQESYYEPPSRRREASRIEATP